MRRMTRWLLVGWWIIIVISHAELLVRAQECDPTTEVCDEHEECSVWKEQGKCEGDCQAMLKQCAVSCKGCDDKTDEPAEAADCQDEHEQCQFWAEAGECENNPNYMHVHCANSCNTCYRIAGLQAEDWPKEDAKGLLERSTRFGERQAADGPHRNVILQRLNETLAYMESDAVQQLPDKIRNECQNRKDLCVFWAVLGECQNNTSYMLTNCAPACHSCEMIDHKHRCPDLPDAVPALQPGDLNRMFERIVDTAPGNRTNLSEEELRALEESQTPLYTVNVISRPSDQPSTEVSLHQDRQLPPWIVTFDDFLTNEECDAMIELGYEYEYKRSEDVGPERFDGSFDSVQSKDRTSENAWCTGDTGGCRSQPVPHRIHERMATIMGIPANHSEDLQLLKYEKGQFYRTHHDYIEHQQDRQCGPRILTFFLYLSDVEAGGGTNFPKLDITVMPKKGRALLWPSIMNSYPDRKDFRTDHQALPVEEGLKFAANGWIHLYEYVEAAKRGCN